MQRQKLYKLHKATYFIVAIFVLKTKKALSDQISTLLKDHVFPREQEIIFFLISSLYQLIYFRKKNKIYYKMQRGKLYNLQSKVQFNCVLSVLKKGKIPCDQYSTSRKNHSFNTNEKFLFSYLSKLCFVNYRTFHAASCDIYFFLRRHVSR